METTQDTLLNGRAIILQPKKGYRVAVDPVLLAASIPARPGETVLDLGSGTGAASFCLAARVEGCAITGIENNPDYLALAQQSAELNGWQERVVFHEGDVKAPPALVGNFDWVMANPPFYDAEDYSESPDAGKSSAHAGEDGLQPWLDCAARFLKPDGWFFLIYPGGAEEEALAAIRAPFREIRILRLWAKADGPTKRLIIAARKGGQPLFKEAGTVILHEDNGDYTEAARAVLWDAAPIPLLR